MEKKAGGSEQVSRRKIGRRKTKKEEEKLKNTSCSATGGVETRGSKSRKKKVTDQSLDETGGIQPPSANTIIQNGSANNGKKRDNVKTTQVSRELDCTDSLTENPSLITSNKLKKKKKKLPPDEQLCGLTGFGGWRCKNFRMSHGAAADDASYPKTKFCEKHYNYFECYNKKKKRSGDGEGAGSGPDLEKQLPPDEGRCCYSSGGYRITYRCKNFRMGYGADGDDDTVPKTKFCEKHYNYYAEYYNKKKKKQKRSGDGEAAGSGPYLKKQLPPDEERCCHTDGKRWRCKKSRMGHDADDDHSVPKTKYCEKHYNHFAEKNLLNKKSSGNGDTSVIGAKRKHVERTEGSRELKSLTITVVETRVSKRRKIATEVDRFVAETSNQPATDDNYDSDTIVEGGFANHGRKRKYAEKLSGELESLAGTRAAAAELESLEHHKSKSVELEKKKAECTELVKKAKKKKTRKTTSTDENEQTLADATDRWKKLLSCLQSKVNEKTSRGCGESPISNSENLVFRSGKESYILTCVELRNSERVESEVPGLQNDITRGCEKPADDSNSSKFSTESSIGGRKDSHLYECKTKEKVLNVCDVGVNEHHESESEFRKSFGMTLHLSSEGQNVEEGKGWGSSSKRSSQHGSPSQNHLERSTEPFADLVSHEGGESLRVSGDFDSHVNSKIPLRDPMDMLAMKNWNRNKDEMKWKSEADMLTSFEEDPELCLKALCALYRQRVSEDEISPKGLLFDDDTLRCSTLAKFLMDTDCKGDVKKSAKELEKFDSKAFGDCKKLVRRYSIYLFDIYENRKDPFFLPATTASHGDESAK